MNLITNFKPKFCDLFKYLKHHFFKNHRSISNTAKTTFEVFLLQLSMDRLFYYFSSNLHYKRYV